MSELVSVVLLPEDENINSKTLAIHAVVEVVPIKLLEHPLKMAHVKICCIFSLLYALAATSIGSRSARAICKFLMKLYTDHFMLV